MTTPASPRRYCAFLLRCWNEAHGVAAGPHGWRFSLEDTETGTLHAFASFEALLAFLCAHLVHETRGSAQRPTADQTG